MTASDDPLLGTLVGRYQLTSVLGQGGMGRVYAAVHPEVGSRVAIKVINEEYARDRDLSDRFFAEARAVNFIRHENIVNVIDLLTLPDGRPVIVMELIEGMTLRELVRRGPTPLGSIVQVMIEVLSALAAAHAAGIIHRDLKPDNILVTASGRAKVLDFGIAKLSRPLPGNMPRTRTGAVLGTPEYMAPEQISGGGVDARTDVYAAGVVLFEALTGRRPFDGPSDFEVMRAHVDLPPPSARSFRAAIPVELEAVIAAALAKAPRDRFANATAMATALHAASAVLPPGEWRAFVPGARAFVRTPAPPVGPAMHASLIGFVPEQSGSLPTRNDRPTPTDTPTRIERPRGTSAPRRRPSWLVPILGATAVATCAIVIAFAVRGGPRSPSPSPSSLSTGSGSGSGSGSAVVVAEVPADAAIVDALDDGFVGIRVPPSFDPRRYDPVAFYPEALKLAQRLMPDARLVTFDAHDYHRDGYVDLTTATPKSNGFVFRSPSGADANVEAEPRNERSCYVVVTLTPTHVEVFPVAKRESQCHRPFVTAPRCAFADIVSRTPIPGINLSFHLDGSGRTQWFLDDKLKIDDCAAAQRPVTAKPVPGKPVAEKPVTAKPVTEKPVVAEPPPTTREPETFRVPVDRASFDPIAYFVTARELAKRMQPDAVLVDIDLMPIRPPGKLHFNTGGPTRARYRFRAPALSRVTDNSIGARCLVEITVREAGDADVEMRKSDQCDEKPARAPRCTVAEVWAKAIAKGLTWEEGSGAVAYGWDSRGWSVRGARGDQHETFLLADDCR